MTVKVSKVRCAGSGKPGTPTKKGAECERCGRTFVRYGPLFFIVPAHKRPLPGPRPI